jgi:hypothetical protein
MHVRCSERLEESANIALFTFSVDNIARRTGEMQRACGIHRRAHEMSTMAGKHKLDIRKCIVELIIAGLAILLFDLSLIFF